MNAYETKLHHQMNEEFKRKSMRINFDGHGVFEGIK